jgi:hypothetical protein
MAVGPLTVLACANCVIGNNQLSFLMLGVAATSLLLGCAVLAFAVRDTNGRQRATGIIAALALLAGFPMALAVSLTSVTVAGSPNLDCGSALSASRERGLPDDRALDPDQQACKAAGAARVREAQLVAVISGSVGLVLASTLLLDRRLRPDKPRGERTVSVAG